MRRLSPAMTRAPQPGAGAGDARLAWRRPRARFAGGVASSGDGDSLAARPYAVNSSSQGGRSGPSSTWRV